MDYTIEDLLLTVRDICNMDNNQIHIEEVTRYIDEYGLNYKKGYEAIEKFLNEYYQ